MRQRDKLELEAVGFRGHALQLYSTAAEFRNPDTEASAHGVRGGIVMRDSAAIDYPLDLDLYSHEASLP